MAMSEEDRSILYHLAKKARAEIHQQWNDERLVGKDTSEAVGRRDEIARAVFAELKPLLKPRFNFSDLLYEIGVQEGRLKDRRP